MGRLWRDYNLSVTAAVLFLITWLVYAVVEWFDFKNEMSWYGEPVAFGSYLTRFIAFSLENWQSEFLHILFLAWLTSFLIHKGSPSPGTATTGWRRRSSASRGGSTRWRRPGGARWRILQTNSRQPCLQGVDLLLAHPASPTVGLAHTYQAKVAAY